MFCRLVGYLKRGKETEKQLLADILSSLYPAVEFPKEFEKTCAQAYLRAKLFISSHLHSLETDG